MSRWEMFKGLIYQPWKLIISLLIGIVSLYDLFISQFVERTLQDEFPRVVDVLQVIGLPWWAWGILWLILIIIFLYEGSFRYLNKFVEPPELIKLSELRTRGVAIRNEGTSLLSPESVDKWVQKYYGWENEILENLVALSPTKAELWRTLDLYQEVQLSNAVNAKHVKFMGIFIAKLKRLKDDIEEISTSLRLGK